MHLKFLFFNSENQSATFVDSKSKEMEKGSFIIVTLFSAGTIRLDEDAIARVKEGDYPVRVKSKVLATIRELVAQSGKECVVGFLPVVQESMDFYQHYPVPFPEDVTQDHYGDLALYLSPETSCRVVSDLIACGKDGALACREDIVRGSTVIVISDECSDWKDVVTCLEEAGADSVKCVSILQK